MIFVKRKTKTKGRRKEGILLEKEVNVFDAYQLKMTFYRQIIKMFENDNK